MAKVALFVGAAVALLAISASAAEINLGRSLLQSSATDFPPLCKCDTNAKNSPYRLEPSDSVTQDGYAQSCFIVTNTAPCNTSSKCCNGQGVEKVEFGVEDVCKESLKRVTVNGALKSFEYNTGLNVLRITNLGLTAATAPGTKICLLFDTKATCQTLDKLCGGDCKYAIFNPDRDCCPVNILGGIPPLPLTPAFARPPPAPPSPFPHCKCVSDPAVSRLTTVPGSVTPFGNLTKACFKVDVKGGLCPIGSPCCAFDLFKFELDANPACKDALVYSTLDGQKRVRFFQTNPYPVIKVNNINKPFSSVDGTEVCLFLRAPCKSLDVLCPGGKCTVALFNKPGSRPSCCPLTTLA